MKTYKINGVDKSVCCVEQKLAYNIAFACHIGCKDFVGAKARAAFEIDHLSGIKFNPAALQAALNNGLEKYFNNFFIAADFETIGAAFPIDK